MKFFIEFSNWWFDFVGTETWTNVLFYSEVAVVAFLFCMLGMIAAENASPNVKEKSDLGIGVLYAFPCFMGWTAIILVILPLALAVVSFVIALFLSVIICAYVGARKSREV